jgi:hypothetical protein
MSFNTEEEKQTLKASLKNTSDLNETLKCLEHVLHTQDPFALYVATADRSDCSWIFDAKTIYDMVGGEDKYDALYKSIMFPEEETNDNVLGVIFFIFKKVGPIYAIKIDLELIDEIIEELYNEI